MQAPGHVEPQISSSNPQGASEKPKLRSTRPAFNFKHFLAGPIAEVPFDLKQELENDWPVVF